MTRWGACIAVILLSLIGPAPGVAETIQIAAFGDSSVFGGGRAHKSGLIGGVSPLEAFPAKLEKELRARGWDVVVYNKSVPGRAAGAAVGTIFEIPPGIKLTIVRLGAIDLNDFHTSPEVLAGYLSKIIDDLHAMNSAVILCREWPSSPVLETVGKKADLLTDWWNGLFVALNTVRPEYDSGDGEHLNAAGTDIVVHRAIPDVERVLIARGFRPGS